MGGTMLGERVPVDMTEAAPRVQERSSVERTSYAPAAADDKEVIYPHFGPRMQVIVVLRQPDRVYRLRGTLAISLRQEDGGVVCAYHRRLPVLGYGENPSEAISDFCEMFDVQYRGLVDCDQSDLSEGAQEARRTFEALVEDISPR